MLLAYALGLGDFLSLAELKKHRQSILLFAEQSPFLSACAYITCYTALTALSVPGGAFLSIVGGFLFPQPWSTLYVVTGATMGAIAIFTAAKTALGDSLRNKAGPFLQKMAQGFHKNAANYLLFLRLVPLFPFWLVNLAPALFGVPLRTYAWTTFVGIIPGAFVFTQAGAGLGAILDGEGSIEISDVLNPQMRLALAALAIFASDIRF
jgi:uncharacterized membrane protein YdjX (TVP38/TMEM64 family)